MRIFLTGGTGFIGSHVASEALKLKHNVRILRRNKFSQIRINTDVKPDYLDVPLDALKAEHLKECDALIHLAAAGVSPQRVSIEEAKYWNVTVGTRLLKIALKAGIKKIIIAGSFAEYGRSADLYESIPWWAPLQPLTTYASSKAEFYNIAGNFSIKENISLVYLRVFSAYGSHQNTGNLLPSLRAAALAGEDFLMTTGDQIRDFVDVATVAKSFIYAATTLPITMGDPLVRNIGTGTGISVRNFAIAQWEKMGATGKIIFGGLQSRQNEPFRYVAQIEEPFALKLSEH